MNKLLRGESNTRRLRRAYYIAAIAVLFSGMAIYILFRNTKNMLLFRYLPRWSFMNTLYFPINSDSIWSDMFIFNLPYGLWCLSGLFFVRAVWLTKKKWGNIYGIVYIAIVMSYVLLKLPGIIPGTFDVLDLVFMVKVPQGMDKNLF
jgi:hypothetical protein